MKKVIYNTIKFLYGTFKARYFMELYKNGFYFILLLLQAKEPFFLIVYFYSPMLSLYGKEQHEHSDKHFSFRSIVENETKSRKLMMKVFNFACNFFSLFFLLCKLH